MHEIEQANVHTEYSRLGPEPPFPAKNAVGTCVYPLNRYEITRLYNLQMTRRCSLHAYEEYCCANEKMASIGEDQDSKCSQIRRAIFSRDSFVTTVSLW